jgi:hypothetical protein
MKRKKGMVRNIFHWVWIFYFYVFTKEEPNPPRKLGGGVFALVASKRSRARGGRAPSKKFGGLFLLSWPLRGAKNSQGNLGGFFFLRGL